MKNNETKKKNGKGTSSTKVQGAKASNTKNSKVKNNVETKVEKKVADKVVVEKNTSKSVSNVKVNNNKRTDILLIIGLVIVVVLGFLLMGEKETEPTYELPLTLSGEAGLHELSYQEYQ